MDSDLNETGANEAIGTETACSIPAASTKLPENRESSSQVTSADSGNALPGAGKGAGRQSYVYFIQAGVDGPIKIGTTLNPTRRMHALQTASAVKLRYIGEILGDRLVEERLHAQLRVDRIQGGEWFHPTPAVLAVCAEAERQMIAAEAEARRRWCSMPRITPELLEPPAPPQRTARAPKRRVGRPRKQAEPAPSPTRYATAREWLAARRTRTATA
jgi:hypothetical protein